MLVIFIGGLPWAIKAIFGPISDKWGSKKLGKRFPWIAGFGSISGFFWLMMTFYLPIDQTIYTFFAFYYFFTQLGTAFSDTALDSFMPDLRGDDVERYCKSIFDWFHQVLPKEGIFLFKRLTS